MILKKTYLSSNAQGKKEEDEKRKDKRTKKTCLSLNAQGKIKRLKDKKDRKDKRNTRGLRKDLSER